jgi:hypothetical protein
VEEISAAQERIDRLLRYLDDSLTRRLPVPRTVWALRIYNETEDGESYTLQPADDISEQGDACVDDVCRAMVLACDVQRETGRACMRRSPSRAAV